MFRASLAVALAFSTVACGEKTPDTPSPPKTVKAKTADLSTVKPSLTDAMLGRYKSADSTIYFEFLKDESFVSFRKGRQHQGRYKVESIKDNTARLRMRASMGIELGVGTFTVKGDAATLVLGPETHTLTRTQDELPARRRNSQEPGLQRFFFGQHVKAGPKIDAAEIEAAQKAALETAFIGDWQQDVANFASRPEFQKLSPNEQKRNLQRLQVLTTLLNLKFNKGGVVEFDLGPMSQRGTWQLVRAEADGRFAVQLDLTLEAQKTTEWVWFKREGELLAMLKPDGTQIRFGRRSSGKGVHSRGHDHAAEGKEGPGHRHGKKPPHSHGQKTDHGHGNTVGPKAGRFKPPPAAPDAPNPVLVPPARKPSTP